MGGKKRVLAYEAIVACFYTFQAYIYEASTNSPHSPSHVHLFQCFTSKSISFQLILFSIPRFFGIPGTKIPSTSANRPTALD